MIDKTNVKYAEELIRSIRVALQKIKRGSKVEGDYLKEKVTVLHKLVNGNED